MDMDNVELVRLYLPLSWWHYLFIWK